MRLSLENWTDLETFTRDKVVMFVVKNRPDLWKHAH